MQQAKKDRFLELLLPGRTLCLKIYAKLLNWILKEVLTIRLMDLP